MSKNKSSQPIRTCVICRKLLAKTFLQRYVWEPETGAVVLDREYLMPGRGAYCCMDETCRERFLIRKQGWKKAFRLN